MYVGVYITQNGNILSNNSAIIGVKTGTSSSLDCLTDNPMCCMSTEGEWYDPQGMIVYDEAAINRSISKITLFTDMVMESDQQSTTRVFCCRVPDATGITQIACVHSG